jgi:hypothetical protein
MSQQLGRNHALNVVNRISALRQYNFPVIQSTKTMCKNLAAMAMEHDIRPIWPDLDADISDVGEQIEKFHMKCDAASEYYTDQDIFIYGGRDANANFFLSLLRDETGQLIPGATELAQEMVTSWLLTANTYNDQRRASASLQMKNAGATDEEIAAILSDQMQLRQFIQDSRSALICKLTEIENSIEANDPMNLPTAKELELFRKHQHWFEGSDQDDDAYFPNDGAVNYPMLLVELYYAVIDGGASTPLIVYDATEYILKIMHSAMSKESTRRGWNRLATISDFMHEGINVGAIIRNYVTDEDRCIAPQDKLSSPVGRSPLRIMRIAECLFDMPGPYSILNAPDGQVMKLLVALKREEEGIAEESRQTNFIAAGADGFSVALSISWLLAMERTSLLHDCTGRNDLSVPKLLSSITNVTVPGLDDLDPRDWALDHDIKGRSEEDTCIEMTHFRPPDDIPPRIDPKAATPSRKSIGSKNTKGGVKGAARG